MGTHAFAIMLVFLIVWNILVLACTFSFTAARIDDVTYYILVQSHMEKYYLIISQVLLKRGQICLSSTSTLAPIMIKPLNYINFDKKCVALDYC